jgi:hypothetical protein
MADFALLDVVTPYVLGGAAIGDPLHELLSALFVTDVETSFDDNGIVVSGMARFSADLTARPPRFTPPANISFAGTVTTDHDTTRQPGAFWDFPDIAIRFRLTAPRTSSPVADLVVNGGPSGSPAPLGNAGVRNVLTGLGQGAPAAGAPAADAPETAFHLDLLIDAATLHLPFLAGATLDGNGILAPDANNPHVTLTLPKIKLSVQQTSGSNAGGVVTDPVMSITLDSWAAHDIDDPTGTAYAELLRMNPPYALIGPGSTLGFGFQTVVVDLSGTVTPPELLAKFGLGEDFRGIYLPDVRVFFKVPGLDGLSFDVSARELVIGIGPEGGLSGIFGVDVVKPDAPQSAVITVYDEYGQLVTRIETPEVADSTQPAPPWTAPPVAVPRKSQWVVDVAGGQPPYRIEVNDTVQDDQPTVVTIPAGAQSDTVTIEISDEDVHEGGQSRTITVPVQLTAPSVSTSRATAPGAAQPAALNVVTAGPPGYTITMLDTTAAERVTLVFTPPDPKTATVDGTSLALTGGRATIDLKHNEQGDVTATWDVPAVPAGLLELDAQFQYAQPLPVNKKTPQDPEDPAWILFAANKDNIRTKPSLDTADPYGRWTDGATSLLESSQLAAFVAEAKKNPTKPITLYGSASKEQQLNEPYNFELSQRRIWAMERLLKSATVDVPNLITPQPQGEQPPEDPYRKEERAKYRRVHARLEVGGSPATTAIATVRLTRPPRPQVPVPVKPTVVKRQPVGSDNWRFKQAHLRLVMDHSRLIAVEVRLKIDVRTVLETYLTKVKDGNSSQLPPAVGENEPAMPVGKKKVGPADPNDGVLDMRVQVTLDDTVDRWHVVASLFENDKDGFLQSPPPSATNQPTAVEQFWRDFFGTMIALTPLLDAVATPDSTAGSIVALAAGVAVPFAAVQTGVVHVPRITLYGGEFTLSHDNAGTRGALLLDVEVALVIALVIGGTTLIDTNPKNPITVRYKAIGFATSDQPNLSHLVPVFDSSKGYTLNVPSTGGISVPEPLGDILQVAGTRIARSNPVNIELDLELKADLGVVSVDRTTIRIPLEEGHAPTIGALGVHIDVPGAIEGHGYLAISPDGFAGQLDVSLPGLGVRVAAGLSVGHVTDPANAGRSATSVLVTLAVDFPVPIAMGASGLGIYGFGGLFALHRGRNEDLTDAVPALDWLKKRRNSDPTDLTGWEPRIDTWAIGLAAVLGTMDSGFTLNVKGMLIFEMPGPRILLVMKASLLEPRPQRQGEVTATILAVIDVDLGRGRISIGLSFDYAIEPLLRLHLPVRAIFPFQDAAHFAIDAGSWYNPATVEFFELFTARGYFMIRGKGIPDTAGGDGNYDAGHLNTFPLPDHLGGFAIATGASVSFLWGNKSSGLYLSVGASIDVGLGFAPIMFSGTLKLSGELHLWIIGIEAAAQLSVTAGQVPDPVNPGQTKNIVLIDGEVRGSVDLFFFTIEGSVHVTLGDEPDSPSESPPDLVRGVSLQSRAAALLSGMSSDRPIDGKLTDAHHDGSAVPAEEAVPIDSIVVVHFDCTPRVKSGAAFSAAQTDSPVSVKIGTPDGPSAPAVRRGEPYYTYRVTGVSLDHALTDGKVPIVWWPGVPNPDAESKRELALLTRVPDPHPSAVERSRHRTSLLEQTWVTMCIDVAPPTSVLWTFHDEPSGPSPTGWVLLPGTAWPDPDETQRNSPPRLRLDVAETWRSGNPAADLLSDIAPARVIGGEVTYEENCGGHPKVLEAPFLRMPNGELLRKHPLGDVLASLAEGAMAGSKQRLDDVVAFSTGEITEVRMLLAVPRTVLEEEALVLRCFDADGAIVDEIPIDGAGGRSRFVYSSDDLPERWSNPAGPWHCPVSEVITFLKPLQDRQTYQLVLVDTGVAAGTTYLHTGLRDLKSLLAGGLGRPSYLIGVVETLTAAEVERHSIESEIKSTKVTAINNALEGIQDPQALLLPGTEYTVRVDYEWATCDADGSNVGTWTAHSQGFTFRTDDVPLAPTTVTPPEGPATVMPVRLDPWVLLTDPDEGEHFFFWGKPLRAVFSVDYLLDMFATYGVSLRARVRAASFANATEPALSQTMKELGPADLKPVAGTAVRTPWEDTIREVVRDLPCVNDSGSISRQTVVELDRLLEPRTDYVFDIEPVDAPPPPPGTTVTPLFRRKFTTSRYHDAKAMCADVAAATMREFPAAAGEVAALEALATAPGPLSAAALDEALRQAGLRPVLEVDAPEVDVVWVPGSGGLQPRILVLRTPEPLVRTRREPEEHEPPGQPRLQRKVIHLVDKPYLEVVPPGEQFGAPPMQVISRPGLNTVVVVIEGGRGLPIGLMLREHLNPFLGEETDDPEVPDTELLKLTLDAATWEVG